MNLEGKPRESRKGKSFAEKLAIFNAGITTPTSIEEPKSNPKLAAKKRQSLVLRRRSAFENGKTENVISVNRRSSCIPHSANVAHEKVLEKRHSADFTVPQNIVSKNNFIKKSTPPPVPVKPKIKSKPTFYDINKSIFKMNETSDKCLSPSDSIPNGAESPSKSEIDNEGLDLKENIFFQENLNLDMENQFSPVEDYANIRMAEMEIKNSIMKERYMEVECDKYAAERQNASVTNSLRRKRETLNKKVYNQREWDIGKPDIRKWKSLEHCNNWMPPQTGFRNRYFQRKDTSDKFKNHSVWKVDTDGKHWNKCSKYDQPGNSRMNYKQRKERNKPYKNQHNSSYHYESPDKRRGYGYQNNEYYKKYHVNSEEKCDLCKSYSKKLSTRAHSLYTSTSVSKHLDNVSSMKKHSDLYNNNKENIIIKQTQNWVNSLKFDSSGWGINQHSMIYNQDDKEGLDSNFADKGEKVMTVHISETQISPQSESNFSKQYARIQFFESKRSPPYISSGKNEHVTGHFDVCFKDGVVKSQL